MDYIGCRIKGDELIVDVYVPGTHGLPALKEIEISVPTDAPEKIRINNVTKEISEVIDAADALPEPSKERLAEFSYLDECILYSVIKTSINGGKTTPVYETRTIEQGLEQGYESPRAVNFAVVKHDKNKHGKNNYSIIDQVEPKSAMPELFEYKLFLECTFEGAIKTADDMISAREKRTLVEERARFDKETDDIVKRMGEQK